MKPIELVVLASGRGTNYEAIALAIEEERLSGRIKAVISDKENAPVLDKARSKGIETIFVDPKENNFEERLIAACKQFSPDYICLAGFMRILRKGFIEAFRDQIINIHPSLLPAFPGLKAQEQAFNYGVKYSGCTVHFVDEGMDSGPIIAQSVVPVKERDALKDLTERILREEHTLFPQVLQLLAEKRVELKGRKVVILDE
ncbi:phosphoribosylglycinamide formyltransferase-1 [Desulfitispora alkaliphila]|uniref:phosphoribosylglycinamide formyltransferase n=1 Tax=Desulfitispora alkaliphila TaxID=622674 RepID=UPI003D1ACEB3